MSYIKKLKEICKHCGYTLGSHCADNLQCPATECGIDFKQGPGTVFEGTGESNIGKSNNNTKEY